VLTDDAYNAPGVQEALGAYAVTEEPSGVMKGVEEEFTVHRASPRTQGRHTDI
jgi:hypothetical protein